MRTSNSRLIRLLLVVLVIGFILPKGDAQSPNEPGPAQERKDAADHSSEAHENLFISLDGAPSMGDPSARIAMVEFGDFECPYCGMHATQTLPQIVTDYVKTGKIRYFFKDLPIEELHPHAFKAAEAAHCAGEQGKYWEMHDLLFKYQQALGVNELSAHGRVLGLDVPRLQQCMDNGTYANEVRRNAEEAKEYRVPGTPEFYVGTLDDRAARMTVVRTINGTQPYTTFQEALDPLVSRVAAEARQED